MSSRVPPFRRGRAADNNAVSSDDQMSQVYRLNPRVIWRRMRAEPAYFWLFCGYLFFEYFRPQGIFPVIDFFPWAQTFILGSFMLVLLARDESKSIAAPLTAPLFCYYLVLAISVLFAFDAVYSMRRMPTMINWLLVYLLFLWIVNTKFRFFVAFAILFLASFKVAQHGFRLSASRGFGYSGWGVMGPEGWFQNAADLGVQMAIFTPWAVAVYLGLKKHWDSRLLRWLFLFAPIAGVFTGMATGQRNTAVAFVAMGFGVLLMARRRMRNLVLVAVAGAAVYSIMPDDYKARFETAGTDDTSESRLTYWEYGKKIYSDHPVIGVGFHNWVPYTVTRYPEQFTLGRVEVAHSVPITVAVETGTLGLVTYYWLVLAIFLANFKSARLFAQVDPPFWRYMAVALNIGLVGFAAAGLFLSIVDYPFLWFQAGLTAALYRVSEKETGSSPNLRKPKTQDIQPFRTGKLAVRSAGPS